MSLGDPVHTFPFHRMEPVEKGRRFAYRLATFVPDAPAGVIGATLGLLTNGIPDHTVGCVELYIAVTRNAAEPDPARNWEQLKRDFVFYLQRDVYAEPTGAGDLTQTFMLPAETSVHVSKEAPLHVLVGVGNMLPYDTDYDAFGCLYYVGGGSQP